jgi:penicillin-binding protein 1A
MVKSIRRFLKRRRTWLILSIAGAALFAALLLAYLTADLPQIESLADYRPPQVSKLYSIEGHVVGQFAKERRTVVPFARIPKHVVHAFLAAEDAEFYHHKGLDYEGILRAFLKNLRPGAHLQGASTITQQTVKTLILGHERSILRKIREVVLARKLEHMLSKNDILHIYLNQIYLGAGAYGIEEAAQTYFNKHTPQLTLAEATLLAGIPKHPSKYAPKPGSVAAKQRQAYVLGLMLKHGWASQKEVDQALATPIADVLHPQNYLGVGPHYIEHVRTQLIEKYGEDTLYTGGLQVQLAMSATQQKAAHRAVRQGLEDLAQKQGYKGPPAKIPPQTLPEALQTLHSAWASALSERHKKDTRTMVWLWDLSSIAPSQTTSLPDISQKITMTPLEKGARVRALVTQINPAQNTAHIDLGSMVAHIPLTAVTWARSFSSVKRTPAPRKISDVFMPGHMVDVIIKNISTTSGKKPVVDLALTATPEVQAALVAIDPHTRGVTALVGGYSEDPAQFNRATQAHRQPGSAFKPLLYAAGLEQKVITPASLCTDTPVEIGDKWDGDAWRPENFEDGHYDGNITYRKALMLSKNTCSAKLADKLGVDAIVKTARALGIVSPIPHDLTIALGSGDITPLELCNAYTSMAASGKSAAPVFIRMVKNSEGKILEETKPNNTQALSSAAAYVLTSMMRSVVTGGTGARALSLGRPVVGKTGTSNDSRNVWFSGFAPDLVATVWVGFDNNQSMGWETGSTGALPIWVQFMAQSLTTYPVRDFHAPEGVVFVNIDPATGTPTGNTSGWNEVFISGTEPSAQTQILPSIYEEDEGNAQVKE